MFVKKVKFDKRGEPLKPRKTWKKVVWTVLFSILLLIASYGAYIFASGSKIFQDGSLTASPFFKKISGQSYTLKGEGDGRINILIMGMGGANHPGGQLTDSIMVASINPEDKTMAILSIPRDLYVPLSGTKTSKKINEVYKTGEDKKKGSGGEYAKETVGKILDLPIHYYVTVDFYAFKKIIDQVGGVDVNVEKALYDNMYPADDMVHYQVVSIKAGNQHMNGDLALKYARSRETSSDFDRAARQQKVVQALRQKLLDKGYLTNPKNILELVNIVSDHVKTDFSADELMAMAKMLKDLDFSKTVNKVLTNGPDGELVSDSSTGTYTLRPKSGTWEGIQKIAHEIFTDPDLKREDARIEVANGTQKAGLASNLADTLKSYNYNVVSIITGKTTAKTVIYDYTNGGKPVTIEFLERRLNVKATEIVRPAASSGIDISIVLGEDYKGFTKEPAMDDSSSSKSAVSTGKTSRSTN